LGITWYSVTRRCDRIQSRVPIALLTDSDGEKSLHEAVTADVSHYGLRIVGRIPLFPGQTVEVIPGYESGETVRCRVVWVRAAEAGLEFLNPPCIP
jgi:hypothetical protein